MEARFYGLNIIFRFDIHHFLTKTEDPLHTYLSLDPESLTLRKIKLPRVYHINVILKNTVSIPDGSVKVYLNKFRLIVDKNGIKGASSKLKTKMKTRSSKAKEDFRTPNASRNY